MKSPKQDNPLELPASLPMIADMVMGKKYFREVRKKLNSKRGARIKDRRKQR